MAGVICHYHKKRSALYCPASSIILLASVYHYANKVFAQFVKLPVEMRGILLIVNRITGNDGNKI